MVDIYNIVKPLMNDDSMHQSVTNQSPKKPPNPKIEKIKKEYYSYLEKSGISVGFQIIFNEIVGKGIK